MSRLTPEGQLAGAAGSIETAVAELGIQWFAADHEAKLACGIFVIELIQKLIPDYDFSRNIYAQFFFFAKDRPVKLLVEGAKQLSETAAAARTEDPAVFIAMGSVGQLFSLLAISLSTNREATGQTTGDLYASHSRTVNDMIQYVLYHRGNSSFPTWREI